MELFKLFGTIAVENEQANRAIADTASNAEEGSEKTSNAFQKIGHAAGTIVKGIATAGAVLGGGSGSMTTSRLFTIGLLSSSVQLSALVLSCLC